jgi:hypothetical protein
LLDRAMYAVSYLSNSSRAEDMCHYRLRRILICVHGKTARPKYRWHNSLHTKPYMYHFNFPHSHRPDAHKDDQYSSKRGRSRKAVNAPHLRDESEDDTEKKGEADDGTQTPEWAVDEVEDEDRYGW